MRKTITKSDWITIRTLYALLALHPSASLLKDVDRVKRYLEDTYGRQKIIRAMAQVWEETCEDPAYQEIKLAWDIKWSHSDGIRT